MVPLVCTWTINFDWLGTMGLFSEFPSQLLGKSHEKTISASPFYLILLPDKKNKNEHHNHLLHYS